MSGRWSRRCWHLRLLLTLATSSFATGYEDKSCCHEWPQYHAQQLVTVGRLPMSKTSSCVAELKRPGGITSTNARSSGLPATQTDGASAACSSIEAATKASRRPLLAPPGAACEKQLGLLVPTDFGRRSSNKVNTLTDADFESVSQDDDDDSIPDPGDDDNQPVEEQSACNGVEEVGSGLGRLTLSRLFSKTLLLATGPATRSADIVTWTNATDAPCCRRPLMLRMTKATMTSCTCRSCLSIAGRPID